jgi:hypothetical protein
MAESEVNRHTDTELQLTKDVASLTSSVQQLAQYIRKMEESQKATHEDLVGRIDQNREMIDGLQKKSHIVQGRNETIQGIVGALLLILAGAVGAMADTILEMVL